MSNPLAAEGRAFAAILPGGRRAERPWRSERALLRAAQRGSPDALDALARTHWQDAYRIALGVTGDAVGAEDVAQDALLAAIRSLDRFDHRRPFGPWLHRIVTNRALDWIRARERRAEVRLDGTASPRSSRLVGEPPDSAIADELTAALRSLGAVERAVVVLRHVLGYSSEEIAQILDKPPATVRSVLHRALEHLRERLRRPAEVDQRRRASHE